MPKTLEAYQLLREKIITLELEPGQPVDERMLQNRCGLGRTPIREAILKLEADNLLEIFPGKGTYVKQITLKGVRDLLQALLALERSAVHLAVLNITPEQLKEVRLVEGQVNEAIRAKDPLKITMYNSQFHRLIARASGNEYLSAYIQKIRIEEQRLAFLCFSKDVSARYPLREHFEEVTRQHGAIVSMLEKRNARGLDRELVQHNRLFQRRIFGYLESYLSPEAETGKSSPRRRS